MRIRSRAMVARVMSCGLAGVLMVGLAACGSGTSANPAGSGGGSCAGLPDGPVKIGSVLSLSGAFAALGANSDKGAQIAVEVFNAHNDICGRKVERVREDDKGDPATAVAAGRKLASEDVNVYIDAGRGQTGEALVPFLMKQGAVLVSDSGFEVRFDLRTFPTYFGVNPSNAQYMQRLADNVRERGLKKIGILTDGLAGGTEYTQEMSALLEEQGNPAVGTVTYSPTAIDLSSELQQLREAGAETLFLAGNSGVANIVASLKASSWKPQVITWGGFFAYAVQPADLPPGTTDLCFTHLPADQAPDGTAGLSPVAVELLEKGRAEIGENNPAVGLAVEAYNRLLVAKAGIEKAGSTDTAELKAAMESLQGVPGVWPGLTYSFAPDDHKGYPQDQLGVCRLQTSPLNVKYLAT